MIASLQNPLIKHLARLREDKGYREEQKMALVIGSKMVREIAEHQIPRRIFFTQPPKETYPCESIQVTEAVLKKITNLSSQDTLVAEFLLPPPSSLKGTNPLLVLDSVRDPGNLGTLLRTALAFGWKGVFFLPTCVDPFNDKALRASRGALFSLPWREGSWQELAILKKEGNLTPYIADTEGEIFTQLKKDKNILLLLSNEGSGLGPEGEEFGKKITIPMEKGVESLNVAIAGAILLNYLRP